MIYETLEEDNHFARDTQFIGIRHTIAGTS